MTMLPAGVGSPHLDVDETIGRIPLADERAPPDRDAEPGQPQIEHRTGRERRRPAHEAETKRGRSDQGGDSDDSAKNANTSTRVLASHTRDSRM